MNTLVADHPEDDKPIVHGPVDANVFAVAGAAGAALKRAGQYDKAVEMYDRVTSSGSYDKALTIISEYVTFNL